MSPKLISAALACLICAFSGMAEGRLAEPFHVVYGAVRACGQPVAPGAVIAARHPGAPEVVAQVVVQDPGAFFALDLPLDTAEPRAFGFRPGETAELSLSGHGVAGCGEAAGTFTVGERGTFRRLDLDPAGVAITTAVTLGDASVVEGDAGNVAMVFTVSLTELSEAPVTLQWGTDDANPAATATVGVDYLTGSGAVTINPGDPGATFAVAVRGETAAEPNEVFFVKILTASGAVVLDPLGQGTIVDDDTPPSLAVGDLTVTEPLSGSVEASFRISLSHAWDVPVSVAFATRAGTATANVDYLSRSGIATIPAGQLSTQVAVEVLFDPGDEGDETFFLDLSAPVGATLLDAVGQATIVDTIQFLFYIEKQQDGVGPIQGLAGAWTAAASPDGRFVYAAARASDAILCFRRDLGSGQLTFLARYQNGSGGISGLDGVEALWVGESHLYAAGYAENAVAVFARDNVTGALTWLEKEVDGVNDPSDIGGTVGGLDGAGGLAVSPDGKNLYAAGWRDNAVAVFSRNDDPGSPNFGKLSFLEAELDGVDDPTDTGGTVNGSAGASAVLVSADGQSVYVTGFLDDAVALFRRETTVISGSIGKLSYVEMVRDGVAGITSLAGPVAAALSPDGRQLYVAAQADNALDVFTVAADGRLTLLQTKIDGNPDADALEGIADVAVSADGKVVFTAAYFDDAVTAFRRRDDAAQPNFGRVITLEVKRNGIGGVDGIDGAVGLATTADNGSVYVAGNAGNALAVFARDLQLPTNPGVTGSLPAGIWKNERNLEITWSGATDAGGGSGVKGYSVLFDGVAATVPDLTVDVYHGADPHHLDQLLEDGQDHYFHLLTCDWSDNCTGAVHLGPFWIDTVKPGAPGAVASISHQIAVPDAINPIVSMTWNPSSDPGTVASGVGGYVYRFDQLSAADCDPVQDSRTTSAGAGSIPLPDGTWYFHVCAIDLAGNTSPTVTVGPYLLGDDLIPPRVFDLTSVPLPETGSLSPWVAPTQLRVVFDEAMLDPLGDTDPADVTNLVNYRLVEAGANSAIETLSCTASVADDVLVPIQAVRWDSVSNTAAIVLDESRALPKGLYRLFACGTLRDILSNRLDGNHDGSGGDDYFATFEIASENYLENPNFDVGIAGWAPSEAATWENDDADLFFSSASAGVENSAGPNESRSLAQCVDVSAVEEGTRYELSGRAKLVKTTPGDPTAGASIVFFAQAGCFGPQLGLRQTPPVVGDTAGAWERLEQLGQVPAGAISALVSFAAEVGPEPDYEFQAGFDSLSLTIPAPATLIFFDGFESGTTAGWSQTLQ